MPKVNIEQSSHMPSSLTSIDIMNATHILQNETASIDDNSSEPNITIQDQSMRTVSHKTLIWIYFHYAKTEYKIIYNLHL